jgi:MoaA/NifB/PqqE/SkfB family radical SAM enzyme
MQLLNWMNFVKLSYYFLKHICSGLKYPIGISVDVTHKCNMACKHCYFIRQNYKHELDRNEYMSLLRDLKRKYPTILHATWVGGEPLLRKDIIEEGMKLFHFNMVVTNGTIALPSWKRCVFNVSVDGTKDYYKQIRGLDCYDLVKRNADRDDIRVNIACVLNKQNYYCVEDLLKEWKNTRVGGVIFDFYTPINGPTDELWLDWNERDSLVEKIIDLKRKYGPFILNSTPVLGLMKSENSKRITHNCPLPEAIICIDALGKRKSPCVIGDIADCSKCGCIIPFQIHSLVQKKDLKTFFATRRIFT